MDIKNIIILGDLNADSNTINGRHLRDVCINHNFICHIDEPTRITPTSQTCLDQIISNIPNLVTSCSVTPPISNNDHCTVSAQINFKIPKEQCYKRHIWQYKQGDYTGFRRALTEAEWDKCFTTDDIDLACMKWSDLFLNIAEKHIPKKYVTIRPKDQPWFSNALRLMRRKVKRLFHRAKHSDSPFLWNKYRDEMNNYKSKLDSAEDLYQKNLADSLCKSQNSKKWWSTVKTMLGREADDSYPAMRNGTDNSYVTNNKCKADLFNNFFLSHSNIDTSNAVLPNPDFNSTHVIDHIMATPSEVTDLLKSLDPSKATGPDGISSRLLKEAGVAIVPSLTRLINLSLSLGKVPSAWKKANVVPLHKKDDKCLTNNYRPISLLSIPSKILERIVFKHFYNFLLTNKLLTKFQSGFVPGDSTVHQLSFLYHTFCEALDKKKDVRIVFCDISKAFDKVWHEGLIYKLHKIGVRGILLDWFRDYLNN